MLFRSIKGRANKLYLFNEMRVTDYEENGYYSNPEARYITVRAIGAESPETEMSSLINLARILNRIIILPGLPCAEGIQAAECNLCGFRPDDCWEGFQQIRHGEWREHTFLRSVLVSRDIQYEVLHDPIITFDPAKADWPGYLYIQTNLALRENEVLNLFRPFLTSYVITLDRINLSYLK